MLSSPADISNTALLFRIILSPFKLFQKYARRLHPNPSVKTTYAVAFIYNLDPSPTNFKICLKHWMVKNIQMIKVGVINQARIAYFFVFVYWTT